MKPMGFVLEMLLMSLPLELNEAIVFFLICCGSFDCITPGITCQLCTWMWNDLASLLTEAPPALHAAFHLANGHLMPHQQIARWTSSQFLYGQFIQTKLSCPLCHTKGLNYSESFFFFFFPSLGFHCLKHASPSRADLCFSLGGK